MAAAARAAAQWEAWVENSAKAASTAAAGKVVGAGAVVVRVEVSSAELEGRPAEAAVKAAISVPYLARTVAGMAWAGTVAAVGARRTPSPLLGPIGRQRRAVRRQHDAPRADFRPDTAQRRPSELLSGTPMSAPAQPAGPKHIPKILVVEDTKLAAECLCMVLKELGCTTDHAEDGAEALEHLMMDSEMYSLVLMDLRMPVMDGFDATLAIRKMGIDLPVIAVTADETFDTRRR